MTRDVIATPAGRCTVTVEGGRVVGLTLDAARGARGRSSKARAWVKAWFAGRAPRVPLVFGDVSDFERRVYRVVGRIPRGKTLTYGEVARRAGRPGAARAVGRAMGRNPIALFVP